MDATYLTLKVRYYILLYCFKGDSNVTSGKIGHWGNAETLKTKQLWGGKQQMRTYY